MDRGLKELGIDPRRRGKSPLVENSPAGVPGRINEPTAKYQGLMMAPGIPDDKQLVIDPNLLVSGTLYVPDTNARMKQQLADITTTLHKTLYEYEFANVKPAEDPLVTMMKKNVVALNDTDMQSKLSAFINQYEDMSVQVSSANNDRDEILLQLADWFTTDHVDLDNIKSSINETEEGNIKQSYFDTVTNFEKIKGLQEKIMASKREGKPTKQLELAKLDIQKGVANSIKDIQSIGMQTMKAQTSSDSDAWKYAASEICHMLTSVRGENKQALGLISKKLEDMVKQLEKQALTIKRMNTELRDKKQVVKKLTDQNVDLTEDILMLRARQARYEKDLKAARQLIQSLNEEKLTQDDDNGQSVSVAVQQFMEPIVNEKTISSDPAVLMERVKKYQVALDCLKNEYATLTVNMEQVTEQMGKVMDELEVKKVYLGDLEIENEKLTKYITKMRLERRQAVRQERKPALPTKQDKRQPTPVDTSAPAAADEHECEHCKCHVSEKETLNDFQEEIEELKETVQKWQDKCSYFKKCLADTEMKLSDAYKEISAIRMGIRDTDSAIMMPEIKKKTSDNFKKMEKEKLILTRKSEEKLEETLDGEITVQEPKLKPKPKSVKARYLEKARPLTPSVELHNVGKMMDEQFPGLTSDESREMKLYKTGDLQGKLKLLTNDIMNFVTEIGDMLFSGKGDEPAVAKKQQERGPAVAKKLMEIKDPKEEEARQKKSQVMFDGQHFCSKLHEAFDSLSASLNPQHDEFEAIYRAFKLSQQRNTIRREIALGQSDVGTLQEFDQVQQKNMQEAGPDKQLLYLYFNISNGGAPEGGKESEIKLKETPFTWSSVQRSTSEIDTHNTPRSTGGSVLSGGLLRERSQAFVSPASEAARRESLTQGNKQEMKMVVAGVPKKGLISLSTMNDLPPKKESHREDRRRLGAYTHVEQNSSPKSSLIKRKEILDHMKIGFKLMEDAEEVKHKEEAMKKSLVDYTLFDLQTNLMELTDAKSIRRRAAVTQEISTQKLPAQKPKPKEFQLPAIQIFNPFLTMKSM